MVPSEERQSGTPRRWPLNSLLAAEGISQIGNMMTIVAGLGSSCRQRAVPPEPGFLSCFVAGPLLVYGTLAVTPPLGVIVVAMAIAGLCFGPINPVFATVVQERTPPHMLGRAFGALTAIAQAGIPIGAAVVGFALEGVGLIPTIVGMGAVYVTVTLGMFFNPALRGIDQNGAPESARAP